MEQLNHQIFLLINSSAGFTGSWSDYAAIFVADWLVWALPALLVAIWSKGDLTLKKAAVSAGLTALMTLLAGALIGWLWPHPRPFMLPLGHLLIAHGADASLPSDHLSLWWGITIGLAYSPRLRRIGLLLTLAGLAPASARLYVGVHFPLDMVAAFIIAWGCAHLVRAVAQPVVGKMTLVALRLQRALARRHAHG